jgi:hypothetical protein
MFDNFDFGSSFTSEPAPPPPGMTDPNAISMAEQIGELRGELNQLRSQAATPLQPIEPSMSTEGDSPRESAEPATVIVLRSGRQVETTNYAVMDQTLWNFSARPVQKIPLSSVDVDASRKANAEHGVDFDVSTTSSN